MITELYKLTPHTCLIAQRRWERREKPSFDFCAPQPPPAKRRRPTNPSERSPCRKEVRISKSGHSTSLSGSLLVSNALFAPVGKLKFCFSLRTCTTRARVSQLRLRCSVGYLGAGHPFLQECFQASSILGCECRW